MHRFVALTEFARGKFIEGGLPADQIMVKPNFVQSRGHHGRIGGGGGLFVGRLSLEKGAAILIDAWRRIPQLPLTIVGDGPERLRLEAMAPPNVTFMGRNPFDHAMLQEAAQELADDAEVKTRVAELLTAWDLGLTDIQIEEVETLGEDGKPEKIWMPFGIHIGRDGKTYKIPTGFQ